MAATPCQLTVALLLVMELTSTDKVVGAAVLGVEVVKFTRLLQPLSSSPQLACTSTWYAVWLSSPVKVKEVPSTGMSWLQLP